MPHEIMVWDVFPAVRRELAKALITEQGLKQKDAAELLGITEAAVSQYLSAKRGQHITFTAPVLREIRRSAAVLAADASKLISELYRIIRLKPVQRTMCSIHRTKSSTLPKNCSICRL